MDNRKQLIEDGKVAIGIEFGSTRIKSVLIDEQGEVIATGDFSWENKLIDGIWIYHQKDILDGLQQSYRSLANSVNRQYGVVIKKANAIGISGMMHGYFPFDNEGNQLTEFRTWRNNITQEAAQKLSNLFQYNIPQRWSIAHLYQAILNNEEHVYSIDYLTTLSGYIHWLLTGEKVIGVGEASGMFPIDIKERAYSSEMIKKFNQLINSKDYPWSIEQILPKILFAGQIGGYLTEEGAKLLDITGNLQAGIKMCPPEGDAGTGMVATNSIKQGQGNISAGTSAFAMIVLSKELSKAYENIDIVTTPTGKSVAMAHANNCTSDINAWINLFSEFLRLFGVKHCLDQVYQVFFDAIEYSDKNGGNLLPYGFYSGEHSLGLSYGCPIFIHPSYSQFNVPNFALSHIYSAFSAMKLSLDILIFEEEVIIEKIVVHGGIFKTQNIPAKVLASVLNVPIDIRKNASEGGAWGIALLANYINQSSDITLETYLDRIFLNTNNVTILPDIPLNKGYQQFLRSYQDGISIVHEATNKLIINN